MTSEKPHPSDPRRDGEPDLGAHATSGRNSRHTTGWKYLPPPLPHRRSTRGPTRHTPPRTRITALLLSAALLSGWLHLVPPLPASPTPGEVGGPWTGAPERGVDEVSYVDPTTGMPAVGTVLRAFDPPAQNWLPGHRGVDLSLAVGDPVLAAGNGVVAFVGQVAGTPTLSIDHPDGIRTTYQPVFSPLASGDEVFAGQVVGRLADPGDHWPGLQWGARRGGEYLNPLGLLRQVVIRLKPVDAPVSRRP